MHQYKGKLIVHTGSMFSGKSSSLQDDVKRFDIAGYKTVAFKPQMDDRYAKEEIVTHDMCSLSAINIAHIDEVKHYYNKCMPAVIAIDEIQFIKGSMAEIVNVINSLLKLRCTIIVAGLDIDFEGNAFEVMKELLPLADYLHKHHAVCKRCGNDAWISYRKTQDKERIKLGTTDDYEPLCRECFYEVKED